jgi:hypothetical protein
VPDVTLHDHLHDAGDAIRRPHAIGDAKSLTTSVALAVEPSVAPRSAAPAETGLLQVSVAPLHPASVRTRSEFATNGLKDDH